jgi:UPF0042 nucleotide-binding protein
MKFLIISGLSGAGKTRAAGMLEDLDYYCVDNMPVVMIPKFAELCLATRGRYDKVALVSDVRGRESFEDLFKALDEMKNMGCDYEILFIEASPETIVKRQKESRRKHPLDPEGIDLENAVYREKRMLSGIRERANYIIDTTDYTLGRLQRDMFDLFSGGNEPRAISVNLVSFGVKYGIPIDADLVFDVRFLPNPYYVAELSQLTGLDAAVMDYVLTNPKTEAFMDRLTNLLEFLIPCYIDEGKHSLLIAVGCTGGHHRSVAIARALSEFAAAKGYRTECSHRDIAK